MGAKLPSGWKLIKQHRVSILVVTIILVVAIALIILGYRFDWTGFNGNNKSGKTLWDWMQLLFIPVVLAVAGFLFNHRERKAAELHAEAEREIERQRAKTERAIAADNQQETALQEYINKISELLLHEKLRESQPDDEVRTIARVRTLTVLPRLDGKRKGSVLQFLHESGLIDKAKKIIDLRGAFLAFATFANPREANLSGADLRGAFLAGADLSRGRLDGTNLNGARLFGAKLLGTILFEADLSRADLSRADLSGADLSEADLSEATLHRAIVTTEQLEKAKSLQGATMPDGSIHP